MHNRTCNHCKTPLLPRQTQFCSHACANKTYARQRADLAAKEPWPSCTQDGCDKPARSRGATMCPMHYHRWYRHGDPAKTAHAPDAPSASKGRRYRTAHRPGHPLAMANGMVYVHRQVLYDAIGPGPHACHWCDKTIRWSTRGDTEGLYPDHINGVGDDNRIENLVPSCIGCNTARGQQAKANLLRQHGWWQVNDTIAQLKGDGRREPIEAFA